MMSKSMLDSPEFKDVLVRRQKALPGGVLAVIGGIRLELDRRGSEI
jgi:hypothetical protein